MRNVSLVKGISSSRIDSLLSMAERETKKNTEESRKLAKRYVSLARKISMHYKAKIPSGLKYRICKKCDNFLVPGINCKVRITSENKYAVWSCECGNEAHVFYEKKKE